MMAPTPSRFEPKRHVGIGDLQKMSTNPKRGIRGATEAECSPWLDGTRLEGAALCSWMYRRLYGIRRLIPAKGRCIDTLRILA